MKLWNLAPAKLTPIKGADSDLVASYKFYLSAFFREYCELNNIEEFRISNFIVGNDQLRSEYHVGKTIHVCDLERVILLCVEDAMNIVARESGCRAFSFGYDFDAWLCAKHSDQIPAGNAIIFVSDISRDLIETDWYDN